MAVGYYKLTKANDPQTVCTLFEAEANVTACTVAGTAREADTSILFPDQLQKATLTINNTGGTFDLGFAGEMEEEIAYDASSATIQAALRALTLGSATLAVTGDDPHAIVMALTDPTLVLDITDLTGGTDSTLVDSQAHRDEEVLVFPNDVVFKVVGTTVSAITTAAAALISDTTAYVEVAGGYPAVAI